MSDSMNGGALCGPSVGSFRVGPQMTQHLFSLLLRAAQIENRIADAQARRSTSPIRLLRLKALRLMIKDRIRRSRSLLPQRVGRTRALA
jgi:hypothetical protein